MESNGLVRVRLNWVLPCLIAAFASLSFVPFPRQPYLLDDSLSEKAVLSYADQHTLHYGSEIVFTYGPWGYLVSRHFFPHKHVTQMVVVSLLSFLVALGVCLMAWRLKLFWRTLLIIIFIYLTANIDPRADLLIYSGILCWAGLCMVGADGWLVVSAFCFALITIFAVMVKANFFLVGAVSASAIFVNALSNRRIWLSFAIFPALMGLLLLAWICSGQDSTNLPTFFSNSLSIIKGYDQVVGLDAPTVFRTRGLVLVICAFAAIIFRLLAMGTRAENRPLLALRAEMIAIGSWLVIFLFVLWKHAFVRADLYHMGFLFGAVPLLVLSLELLPSSPGVLQVCSRSLVLASCVIAVFSLGTLFFSSFKASLVQPFAGVRENVTALFHPLSYQARLEKLYENATKEAQLPSLSKIVDHKSVDVFGQEQCYAIFNNFEYRPRPVFQSYLAFNDTLTTLNENFYLSPATPDYVLFQLNAGDRVFPPLQDARLLRHLLLNFKKVADEKPFLLLEKNRSSPAKLKLLSEGMAGWDEHILLPTKSENLIWMEISVQPNWAGHMVETLYKPSKTRIAFWTETGKKPLTRSGAPPPMLAAGFIASPLLFQTEHVQNFLSGGKGIRPTSCSLEIPAEAKRFWNPTLNYRIYAVENEPAFKAEYQTSEANKFGTLPRGRFPHP